MGILVNWLISSLVILGIAYVLPGIHVDNFTAALVTALVIGIITLGLFTLVINALLVLLVDKIVPGFNVDGFLWALIFSIVLSFVNSFILKNLKK